MKIVKFFVFVLIIVLFTTYKIDKDYNDFVLSKDKEKLNSETTIKAVTVFNSKDYFIYKGTPMGFQLEMLREFAEYSGFQFELITCNDVKDAYNLLQTGKCDLVAMDIINQSKPKSGIVYTYPYKKSHTILLGRDTIEKSIVNSNLNLKRVYLSRNTYQERDIQQWKDLHNFNIEPHYVKMSNNELLDKLNEQEIDYLMIDSSWEMFLKTNYPGIVKVADISGLYNVSWATRGHSVELNSLINIWIQQFTKSSKYAQIYSKYFQNPRSSYIVNSDYFVVHTGRLSKYDEYIQKYSEFLGWDWRLLASLIYSESGFKIDARSSKGATGLMQIMPYIMSYYGYDTIQNVETNIKIGVQLLQTLDNYFEKEISDENERIKFILASYNIGLGHIMDAQRLTEKYGKNPYKWEDVSEFLLKKSDIRYYTDPVVKHGKCIGKQTNAYVENVMGIYKHYKNISMLD